MFANTDDAYIFYTHQGIVYEVSFDEDRPIGGCDTYQVTIRKVNQAEGSYYSLVRDTILSIIEEFFDSNQSVLLYICDTSDGRQQARNMLFLRWLREGENFNLRHKSRDQILREMIDEGYNMKLS